MPQGVNCRLGEVHRWEAMVIQKYGMQNYTFVHFRDELFPDIGALLTMHT